MPVYPSVLDMRLSVRRRFYLAAFVIFTVVWLSVAWATAWLTPAAAAYILVGAAVPILGVGAVLWWLYAMRASEFYAKVARSSSANSEPHLAFPKIDLTKDLPKRTSDPHAESTEALLRVSQRDKNEAVNPVMRGLIGLPQSSSQDA